jgi:copper(I)-binding protein
MVSKKNNQQRKERSMRYVLIVASLFGLSAAASETVWRNIRIANPWVHETSGKSALLHVTIANTEGRADRLLRASTPIAAKVAIWNQQGKEGGGIRIPGRAEFVIGGDFPRIELVGLTESLRAHASFNLLLVFEQAGKISFDVHVETPEHQTLKAPSDRARAGG